MSYSHYEIERDCKHNHEWTDENELEYDCCVGHVWETNCGDEAIIKMIAFLKQYKEWEECDRCYNEVRYWEQMLLPYNPDDDMYFPRSEDFL